MLSVAARSLSLEREESDIARSPLDSRDDTANVSAATSRAEDARLVPPTGSDAGVVAARAGKVARLRAMCRAQLGDAFDRVHAFLRSARRREADDSEVKARLADLVGGDGARLAACFAVDMLCFEEQHLFTALEEVRPAGTYAPGWGTWTDARNRTRCKGRRRGRGRRARTPSKRTGEPRRKKSGSSRPRRRRRNDASRSRARDADSNRRPRVRSPPRVRRSMHTTSSNIHEGYALRRARRADAAEDAVRRRTTRRRRRQTANHSSAAPNRELFSLFLEDGDAFLEDADAFLVPAIFFVL